MSDVLLLQTTWHTVLTFTMGLIVAYFELKILLLTHSTIQLQQTLRAGHISTHLCGAGLKCQGMAA